MRLKQYWWVACLATLSLFASCAFNLGDSGLRGSGIVKTESRQVAEFSSISFRSEGKVTVQQTGKESLTISAEDNILPLLESRVADLTLYLGTVNNTDINPTQTIGFMVEVKSLESLNIKGVGSVDVKNLQGKRLSISQDGVGRTAIAGRVDVLDLTLAGVGSFQGEQLKTKQATVRNSGVGSAVVNVSQQLDATVSGVGSIEYIGSPQVRESVRGVGTVKRR